MAAEPGLVADGLSRRFGHRVVLRDLSLSANRGEPLLIVGHNGAGKTTLLRVLAGLLKPTKGNVTYAGRCEMVGHSSMLYDALTARENLVFYARLYNQPAQPRVDELLARLGLERYADRRVETFSRGMVQRLAIARTLLPDPDVVLLDEPTSGLDDAATRTVLEVLHELGSRGRTILIATHQLDEIVEVGSAVGFLVDGRLVAHEPLGNRTAAEIRAHARALANRG